MIAGRTAVFSSTTKNLRLLFVLRNIAIGGQILAVLATTWIFDLSVPVIALTTIIATLAMLNFFTWLRLRGSPMATNAELFAQLALDALVLTGLLYFAGGGTNPFTWLFLLPLAIAAAVLPKGFTWAMAGLTTALYTALMFWYVPFPYPQMNGHHPSGMHVESGFGLHVMGMWTGFVLCAGVIAHFLAAMAETLRARERSLATAREQALRDDRVVALGALAAGTAHELGTPLATMAILVQELEEEYATEREGDLPARLRILRTQVERCREALSVISASAGETRAEAGYPVGVDAYLRGLLERWQQSRPQADIRLQLDSEQPAPRILAERTLTQALLSILDNAADASPHDIELRSHWDASQLVIDVADRGKGLHPVVIRSAGKGVFTTKAQGLGLGLFLAHAVIGRLGGEVSLAHRQGGGVRTRVTLPLSGSDAVCSPC